MTEIKSHSKSRQAIQDTISASSSSKSEITEYDSEIQKPTKYDNINQINKVVATLSKTEKDKSKSLDDADDDEIIAPITIALNGGWGWVVVAASFWHIFCVEGIGFTFGTLKGTIKRHLKLDDASVAVINSITVGFMCLFGPVASALVNRFGFRLTSMTGAVLSSLGAFMASVGGNYTTLLIFYGAIMGLGFSLTLCSTNLIVVFYFEERRALATALYLCGNSIGITTYAFILLYFQKKIGWRSLLMFQSAMLATVIFTSIVFRPLLSLTVKKSLELSLEKKLSTPYISYEMESRRNRGSVNSEYKRAVDLVVERENRLRDGQLNKSIPRRRTSKIVSKAGLRALSKRFSKVHNLLELEQNTVELLITIHNEEGKLQLGRCGRMLSVLPHVNESRPLYRDDAFYTGNVKNLEKLSLTTIREISTGIDYDLSVSRVTTAKDIKEKNLFCSIAVKRVLLTMADPRLLKLKSFFMFQLGVFFAYLALLIPYVYITDRSKAFGVPRSHYKWFVGVIALSGLFGRIAIGIIATKTPALYCCQFSVLMIGISTLISNFIHLYYVQYLYCIVYGFFMSGIVLCRFLIIVDLYGLELLTNGAGLTMLTQGLAFLITLPVAGLLKTHFGVFFSFIYSVMCSFCSAICFFLVPIFHKLENRHQNYLDSRLP